MTINLAEAISCVMVIQAYAALTGSPPYAVEKTLEIIATIYNFMTQLISTFIHMGAWPLTVHISQSAYVMAERVQTHFT